MPISISKYLQKLIYILLPFALSSWAAVGLLWGARWLLCERLAIVPNDIDWWEFILPGILSSFLVFLLLHHRFKLLESNINSDIICKIICWLTVFAMLMCSQTDFTERTRTSIPVEHISDILPDNKPHTYTIAKYSILTDKGYTIDYQTGRHSRLTISIYFVLPFSEGNDLYWYGKKYSKTTTSLQSESGLNEETVAFYQECVHNINALNLQSTRHFQNVLSSQKQTLYIRAIENALGHAVDKNKVTILIPEDQANGLGEYSSSLLLSFLIGMALLSVIICFPKINLNKRKKPVPTGKTNKKSVMDFLIPLVKNNTVLAAIVLTTLMVSLLVLLLVPDSVLAGPTSKELLAWGGQGLAEVKGGEWWRLVTALFLHGSFLHLFLNIACLFFAYVFALFLFNSWWKLGMIYLVSGIIGNLVSLWFHSEGVSVGASGAVMGLFGAVMAIILVHKKDNLFELILPLGFVIPTLLLGMSVGANNAAHLGGLLSGAILGLVCYEKPIEKETVRRPIPKKRNKRT